MKTWHGSDSVCASRLGASIYQVVEQLRPRSDEVIVAAAAAGGIELTSASVAARPFTFKFACARVSNGVHACTILVIYTSRYVAACDAGFSGFADVLD